MKIRNAFLLFLNNFLILFTVLLLHFSLIGCVEKGTQSASAQLEHDGLPVDMKGKNLKQGLKVVYFFDKYRHVDDIPKSEKGIAKFGQPGSPIFKLDNEFGRGKVFGSGRSEEVGMLMTGLIHLEKPGTYLFKAKSNDGIQMFIDEILVTSDPGVHGDRVSEPGQFNVTKGGMFPVKIKYFQRKGTATLRLFWQTPGTSSYSIIPSVAYSHSDE